MKGKPLAEATAAAQAFVAAKLPTDRICVTSFATKPLLLAPFSDSEAERVSRPSRRSGSTRPRGRRSTTTSAREPDSSPRRKAAPASSSSSPTATRLVVERDARRGDQGARKKPRRTVYVVAIESKAFTPGPLKYLAKRTGGRYFGTPSPNALQGDLQRARAELKRTWRLDYITSAKAGRVAEARRIRARARPRLRALTDRSHGRGREGRRAAAGGRLRQAVARRARPARRAARPARRRARLRLRRTPIASARRCRSTSRRSRSARRGRGRRRSACSRSPGSSS